MRKITRPKFILPGLLLTAFLWMAFSINPNKTDDFKPARNSENIKQKIIEKAQKTQSIKSDFIQEKHLTMFEEVMKSKGEFVFKKPNKVRWEYTDPISYIIVLDGKNVKIKDEDKVKTYDMDSNPVFKEINRLLVHSINGKILESNDFRIEYYESKSEYMTRLFPNNEQMKKVLDYIEIYFNKIDFGVTGLKLMEYSQDFTRITFQNRILNEDIKDSSFHLGH